MRPSFPVAVLALLAAGCQSISTADLQRCLSQHGIHVTAGDAPAAAEPIAAVAFQRNGFYIAGIIPVVRVELDDAVQSIASELHAAKADGISNLRYDYSPASLFKFLVFPVPDWSATLSVTGMAYRLPEHPQR